MGVHGIANLVLLFNNPALQGIANLTALSNTIAYSASYTDNITVLTSKYAVATPDGLIQGLLYVPDLNEADPCAARMRDYVSDAAVRQRNLPPTTNLNIIAIFPWVTEDCTKSYLRSARSDPVRAVLVYIPHAAAQQPPPPVSSPVWQLNDGGRWRTENHFPIYALSPLIGGDMVQKLSLYSGNLSEVPYGENIAELYDPDPDAYVRIWTEISVLSPSNISSIWIFILVVIGVLLAIILMTCFVMHRIQARRRVMLRRRVINGEVNLEGMGIKRLTVPADHIQTFPLYTYYYKPDDHSPPVSPTFPANLQPSPPSDSRQSSKPPSETAAPSTTDSRTMVVSNTTIKTQLASSIEATDYQPMCLICLGAYQNRTSVIRELPCGHIFHPACIDEILSEVSLLCPLCKASVLPKGYCPRITNSMVRRELAKHKIRDRIVVEDATAVTNQKAHRSSAHKKRWWKTSRTLSRPSSAETELHGPATSGPIDIARQTNLKRQRGESLDPEVARARTRQLAGSDITDSDGKLSTWGRMHTRMFPGYNGGRAPIPQ